MADDKNEEEYLDKLLKNAMVTDEVLENTTDTNDDNLNPDDILSESSDEPVNELENFSTLKEPEDNAETEQPEDNAETEQPEDNAETEQPEDNAETEQPEDNTETEQPAEEIVDNLKEIVGGGSEDSGHDEVPESEDGSQGDDGIMALSDTDADNTDASDILALDDYGMGDSGMPVQNKGNEDSDAGKEESVTDDASADSGTESVDAVALEDNIQDNGDQSVSRDEKKKKKKQKKNKEGRKKEKPSGKKFSFKSFFLEDEEENTENDGGDENQKLIDELYADKDSLSDEKPEDIGNEAKKPKKEKKEKKPKEKKEKKPKPPKPPKKPKAPHEKLPAASIAKAVLAAAVIAAIILVGSRIFTYRNSMSSARKYFDAGNYAKAYDTLTGLKIKDKDEEFYNMVETVMMVAQGLESYESNIMVNNTAGAIDALIQAAGRKVKFADRIVQYGVGQQVQKVFGRITSLLSEYGISEEQALDYYSMTSHDKYYEILKGYGGVPDDYSN